MPRPSSTSRDTSPSLLKRAEAAGGVIAVRAGNAAFSTVVNALDGYWRVVRWLGTSIVLGGLAISMVISFATTGSPGLTDPTTWPIVQLFLAYPEIAWSALGVAVFLAFCGFLAHRLKPANPTEIEAQQYVLQPVRALDSDEYVPGYQSVYLSRNKGNLDLNARLAVREAALRKQGNGRKYRDSIMGICIFARPTEGKTRLAWETMRAVLPGWTLLKWPYNSPEFGLRRQVLRRRRIVLWLDDLQKYDPETIRELKDLPRRLAKARARFVIIATCRDGQDEIRVRQDLAPLIGGVSEFRVDDINPEEQRQLTSDLKRAGVSIEEGSFDGSPGSMILGLADMRRAYTKLRDDARRILRSLKLLRSIGIYEYRTVHVLAAAGTQGLFDSRWVEARDALVVGRFLRLGPRDENEQPSLIPVADVYVDAVVFDFPVDGSRFEDFWPGLQKQFEERRDGSGLLALGNAYVSRIDASGATNPVTASRDLSLAQQCFTSGLQFASSSADPGTWARLHANLGSVIVRLTPTAAPPEQANLLHDAIKNFQAALIVPEDSYPNTERIETNQKLAAAFEEWGRLTQTPATTAERQRESVQAYIQALRLLDRESDPERWAEAQRKIGVAYRGLAELESGYRASHLDAAKRAYSEALTVFTRAEHSQEWAELQLLLGNANMRRVYGARQETRDRVLAEALRAYTNALTVITADASPIEWATAQAEFARLHLLRAANVEAANHSAYVRELREGKACIEAAFTLLKDHKATFADIWSQAEQTAADLDTKLHAVGISTAVTAAASSS